MFEDVINSIKDLERRVKILECPHDDMYTLKELSPWGWGCKPTYQILCQDCGKVLETHDGQKSAEKAMAKWMKTKKGE